MNKQIEEMAKDIGIAFQLANTTSFGTVAESLVEFGYQKVDKDSVVMSHKELVTIIMNFYDSGIKTGRNETAREILEKIYEQLSKYEAVNEIDYDCWVDDVLYDIAKQYDVEIKE